MGGHRVDRTLEVPFEVGGLLAEGAVGRREVERCKTHAYLRRLPNHGTQIGPRPLSPTHALLNA
jgi:hypothetical protein